MFPNRDIDIYTAAKNTPEREKEFVLSVKIKKHLSLLYRSH